jgi:transketolase
MFDDRSKELRRHIIDMVDVGKRGHIGPAMSLVEVLRVFYDSWLEYDPHKPLWENRDRLIFSKGHGCLALYAILADKGFFGVNELKSFCKFDSFLGGHPERFHVPGVEASSGALGHGLSIAVGLAISAKISKKNHKIVVITGDGEINEGSVWEAAMSASKHCLSNLSLWVDYNKLQSYGPTSEVMELEPLADKLKSFGFKVFEVDGHDVKKIRSMTKKVSQVDDKPSAVICHTIKGKGIPFAENDPSWHHQSYLSDKQMEKMYKSLI